MPSSSSASKQNAASVPSEDTAYNVKPSQDLNEFTTVTINRTCVSPTEVHDLSLEDFLGDNYWPRGFRLPNGHGAVIGTKSDN